jgi:Rrf2 family protein
MSPKYLEQIMIPLRKAGIVESVRGPNGGYVLGRPPEDIRLVEVYRLLEGSAAPVDCLDSDGSCPMEEVCPSQDTWRKIKEAIERVLHSKTLADLARMTRRRKRAASGMYHI